MCGKLKALVSYASCYCPYPSLCSGGSGRTGTFITIANLLDCLKSPSQQLPWWLSLKTTSPSSAGAVLCVCVCVVCVCVLCVHCLKSEGVVDVFQTARTLRLQRPNMVRTVVSGRQSDSPWVAIPLSHCFLSISFHPPTHRSSTVTVTPRYWSIWSPLISMPPSSEHDQFVIMHFDLCACIQMIT